MLKEEKRLRKFGDVLVTYEGRNEYRAAITALVRAVREDCAKVVLRYECVADGEMKVANGKISAAIRGRK